MQATPLYLDIKVGDARIYNSISQSSLTAVSRGIGRLLTTYESIIELDFSGHKHTSHNVGTTIASSLTLVTRCL